MLFYLLTTYCYLLLLSHVSCATSKGTFFDEYWTWFTYYFLWSDEFTTFNPEICSIHGQTYFFGGARESKWLIGKYTWRSLERLRDNVKNRFSDMETDTLGHVKDPGKHRHEHDRWFPLMIGRDYFEPCSYSDKAPKIISFKFSAPVDKPLSRGAYDVFIGRGQEDCGHGRFGVPPADTGSDEYAEWKKKTEKMKKNLGEWIFKWKPSSDENPPIASFNSGGIFAGAPGDNMEKGGRYFTSAVFDPSEITQHVCVIFYCYNELAPCSVAVEHFRVSDIAGDVEDLPITVGGTTLTPMDIFTIFMTFFSLIFFCIQCCCCCQLCALELKGGTVDEQAMLEDQLKQQYINNQTNNKENRNRNRSKSPRHAKRKRKSRSPRNENIRKTKRSV